MTRTAIAEPRGPARLASPAQLRRWAEGCRSGGLTVGMVPTMGALHEGHRHLMRRCRGECDRTVVSIFVNPAQFESASDLARYPREPAADLAVLAAEGVDAVFAPPLDAMYPAGHATGVRVTGTAAEVLEGAARPGHFDGVALVVTKLLVASRPDRLYLGEKDAQQCAVIRRLVLDLDLGVELRLCPIVRDADGLATSSRNRRLSPGDRARALAIPAALASAERSFASGVTAASAIIAAAVERLADAAVEPDYVALVDPDTFDPAPVAARGCRLVVAAVVGGTRIIDALTLGDHLEIPDPLGLCERREPVHAGRPEERRSCIAYS